MSRRPPTFAHLLSPGRIGPLELPNRVVLPAMDMNLCEDGAITGAEIAHYRARALGGTAMLVTGSGAVGFPVGATSRRQPALSDDRYIDGLNRLAEAVHAAGSLLCVQLCHHGKVARVDIADGRPMLVPSLPDGPGDLSALVDSTPDELAKLAAVTGGRTPELREASDDDLAWVVDTFAEAADRVRRAGADAVEIHATHGYLLSTFLSPADNRRTDRWGGSAEARSKLTVDVTAAVRAAVGSDMAVIVRLSGREYGGDVGITITEAAGAAARCVAAGADAIHVSGYGRNSFANFTDGPLPDAVGAYRDDAAAVRKAIDAPVIAVGRILPELGEEMIASGECDFVSMGRQLLADPDLVDKLRAGRRRAVRPCINCYVCVEQNFFDDPPVCAVNPALGQRLPPWTDADAPRHVVVVGGGPAGMEAARIARERGHRVTLLEAGDRLGGTAWFSQVTTPENGPLVDWLSRELDRLGVVVQLSTRADTSVIEALRPDVVVVATGAVRGRPDVPGADLPHVRTGDELRGLILGEASPSHPAWLRTLSRVGRSLRITANAGLVRAITRRWMPVGRHVAIIGGGLVGLELAEFMAERGRRVTVLEPGGQLGLPMAMPRRWTAVRRAADHGVTLVRRAELTEITPTEVVFRADGEIARACADDVVVASDVTASSKLADQLAPLGLEVHVVGDADHVGYIEGAMVSAWSVASSL